MSMSTAFFTDAKNWLVLALIAALIAALSFFAFSPDEVRGGNHVRFCADRETGAMRLPLPRGAGCDGANEFTLVLDVDGVHIH